MRSLKALAVLVSMLISTAALACPSHCLCDKDGHVVSNYKNLVHVSDHNLNKLTQNQSQTQGQGQSQTSTNTNQNVNNNQSNAASTSNASLSNSGNSNNVNTLTAKGGNASATGGTSSATASASAAGAGSNNGNNSNDTSVTTVNPRQVASAFGIAPPPTAPCSASLGAGGQTEIFGLSISGSRRDSECVLEHQVYLLQQLGLNEAACYRARAGKEGAEIDAAMNKAGVDCKTFTLPAPADDTVTHEELKEHEQRIVTKVLAK